MCLTFVLFTLQIIAHDDHRIRCAPVINRARINDFSIFSSLGEYCIRRVHGIDENGFWQLHELLHKNLKGIRYCNYSKSKKRHRNGAQNGLIISSAHLSTEFRFFRGGDAYDFAVLHSVFVSQVCKSAWRVVNAVNKYPQLAMKFPTEHAMLEGFRNKSRTYFKVCAGCIDSLLIQMERLSKRQNQIIGCDVKKFLCKRKKKYGLNMQGVCDHKDRFIDTSICHPKATSDYLSFMTSDLKHKFQNHNFLALNLILFGDNGHVNIHCMATPCKGVSGGEQMYATFFILRQEILMHFTVCFSNISNRLG